MGIWKRVCQSALLYVVRLMEPFSWPQNTTSTSLVKQGHFRTCSSHGNGWATTTRPAVPRTAQCEKCVQRCRYDADGDAHSCTAGPVAPRFAPPAPSRTRPAVIAAPLPGCPACRATPPRQATPQGPPIVYLPCQATEPRVPPIRFDRATFPFACGALRSALHCAPLRSGVLSGLGGGGLCYPVGRELAVQFFLLAPE